jgi:hypothetical protein
VTIGWKGAERLAGAYDNVRTRLGDLFVPTAHK